MSEFNRLDKLLEYMEENRGVFGWKSQCEALVELAERLESEIDSKDKQLAEARAEIESLTRSLTIVANWTNVKKTYTADEVKEFARGILDVAALEAAERGE